MASEPFQKYDLVMIDHPESRHHGYLAEVVNCRKWRGKWMIKVWINEPYLLSIIESPRKRFKSMGENLGEPLTCFL